MNAADLPQQQVQLTEQDLNYMVQALMARPLGEALPLWLKITNQKLVAATPTPLRDNSMFQFPANPVIGQQFAPIVGQTYEWNGTGWVLLGLTPASIYPAAVVVPYAGAFPLPFQGWLPCDGNVYAVSAYPSLFAVIGGQYGGNGTTTFAVPDLRGRVLAGLDNMGTPTGAANRLTVAFSGFNPAVLGGAGGAEGVVLTAAQLAAHAHGIADPGHYHNISDPTHAHGVNDPTHIHGVSDPTHAHTISVNGRVLDVASLGSGNFDFGNREFGYNVINLSGGSVNPSPTGIGIAANGTGISIGGAGTGIGVIANGTGINTTVNAGGGAAHQNVQPTITMNYIIKT